jgi:hypothetical protein
MLPLRAAGAEGCGASTVSSAPRVAGGPHRRVRAEPDQPLRTARDVEHRPNARISTADWRSKRATRRWHESSHR